MMDEYKTTPIKQIDKLAQELYSQHWALENWWRESIATREEWRDKAQAIIEAKRG